MTDQPLTAPYIVGITGTKGKTTVARLLNHVYLQHNRPTLLVDSDGHYVNGRQKSSRADSLALYGLIPTVSPGRYLYEVKQTPNAMAILEVAVGSSNIYGTGYLQHQIGIFTNVYTDHIGRRIKSRKQLATEKGKIIFHQIAPKGTAVFNADDKLIVDQLSQLHPRRQITLMPVGFHFKHFDVAAHLATGGRAITCHDQWIYLLQGHDKQRLLKITNIPWTFDGQYQPSIYNLMLAAAALCSEHGSKKPPASMLRALAQFQPNKRGGRLLLFENKRRGVKVIIDYAHEQYSLHEIAKLARQLATGKTIGVVRVAPTRSKQYVQALSQIIAQEFNAIYIYDKVDGIQTKEYVIPHTGTVRLPGEMAGLMYQTMTTSRKTAHKPIVLAIEEIQALTSAIESAQTGDVIVYISSDHTRSYELIKKMGQFSRVY